VNGQHRSVLVAGQYSKGSEIFRSDFYYDWDVEEDSDKVVEEEYEGYYNAKEYDDFEDNEECEDCDQETHACYHKDTHMANQHVCQDYNEDLDDSKNQEADAPVSHDQSIAVKTIYMHCHWMWRVLHDKDLHWN